MKHLLIRTFKIMLLLPLCIGLLSACSDDESSSSGGGGGGGGVPDRWIISFSLSNSFPSAGDSLTLRATVRCLSAGGCSATTLTFRRDPVLPIISSDTSVGSRSIPALSGSSYTVTYTTTAVASNYYGACIGGTCDHSIARVSSGGGSGGSGISITCTPASTRCTGGFGASCSSALRACTCSDGSTPRCTTTSSTSLSTLADQINLIILNGTDAPMSVDTTQTDDGGTQVEIWEYTADGELSTLNTSYINRSLGIINFYAE